MPSELNPVKQHQAELINSIFGGAEASDALNPSRVEQGLKIYQNNLLMTSAQVLSINYPVIDAMMGEEAMRLLARYLLKTELPSSGDWGDWGAHLHELIKTTPLDSEHPYLASMAELEWSLHLASRGQGTELDVASLSRLSDVELSDIYIELSPTVACVTSQYQVDMLWHLHRSIPEGEAPDVNELVQILSQPVQDYYFLTYQKDHAPCVARLTQDEYEWFASILAGKNLSDLLEAHSEFDFSQWLSKAIEQQWLQRLS